MRKGEGRRRASHRARQGDKATTTSGNAKTATLCQIFFFFSFGKELK